MCRPADDGVDARVKEAEKGIAHVMNASEIEEDVRGAL
jgi:hypothetical protein